METRPRLRYRLIANQGWRVIIALVIIALVMTISVFLKRTAAQAPDPSWGPPINLSNSDTDSVEPSIVIDREGVVHVVWSERLSQGRGMLLYTRFSNGAWSEPIDVLPNPGNAIPHSSKMVVDSSGMLHVIWLSDSVYYSHVYSPLAGSAKYWSPPVQLVAPVYGLTSCDLILDSADHLRLVYSVLTASDSGIYYLESTDRGNSWLSPSPVYLNPATDLAVDKAGLAIDLDGGVYVVWTEYAYPAMFPPLGIRYAVRRDETSDWSAPMSLADGPYDYPRIAVRRGRELHVVWSGTSEDRFKFHRWSPDGGVEWSEVWRNKALGGFQGFPALVVDAEQKLHWLQIGTIFGLTEGDAVYSQQWENGQWMPGTVILGPTAGQKVNAENVVCAVSLGGDLHVLVQTPFLDPSGAWQFDIVYLHWFSGNVTSGYESLPAPTMPAEVESDSNLSTVDVTESHTVDSSSLLGSDDPSSIPDTGDNAGKAVALGLVPVIVLILVVAWLSVSKRG